MPLLPRPTFNWSSHSTEDVWELIVGFGDGGSYVMGRVEKLERTEEFFVAYTRPGLSGREHHTLDQAKTDCENSAKALIRKIQGLA